MKLELDDVVETDLSLFTPAYGATFSLTGEEQIFTAAEFVTELNEKSKNIILKNRLSPLFKDKEEKAQWKKRRVSMEIPKTSLKDYAGEICFMGIDSGSTTTKIAIIGENKELLFRYYSNNEGNVTEVVRVGILKFFDEVKQARPNKPLKIVNASSTGYGEDLIKTAFGLDKGVVETIAHYTSAHYLNPNVSFIMDIGGQDMKAIFIENGIINRIELNESCSSGCGSFIQTFGNTLGFSVGDFATMALNASNPSDLGTRCTVFMNSKVKQSLRENASLEDISAGLALSVIKNALYKVLKLRDKSEMGEHIVVQGGTFKNPAVHRALEVLSGNNVSCTDLPELMGAYGCALISLKDYQENPTLKEVINYDDILYFGSSKDFSTKQLVCKACVNHCTVTKFSFGKNKAFYSGNKCEKVFSNSGTEYELGFNFPEFKYKLLFNRKPIKTSFTKAKLARIGIPRVLNMYENYPFWHSLLSSLGFEVILSKESSNKLYETGQGTIMSDNICFPAKLVHGHILYLIDQDIDAIVYPMEYYQKNEYPEADNSFMCPVVSGYADVISNSMDVDKKYGVKILKPIINYNDEKLLWKATYKLVKEFGVKKSDFNKAFQLALNKQNTFKEKIKDKGNEIIEKNKNQEDGIAIVLAGRPYHIDSLINHKIPEILTHLGVDILTEDALPKASKSNMEDLQVLSQWEYPNRIFNAAQWVSEQDNHFQFVQLNSFGCGPDAIVVDEAAEILHAANKIHTVLKIDEISSTGSVKLRLRSMIESLRIRKGKENIENHKRINTATFGEDDKHKLILGPHFSDIYSPFIPAIFEIAGFKYINLPPASKESVQYGLKYSNNEICYPATIVVGEVMQAINSGKYDRNEIAIGITQTGGQCRASTYLSLIKKAMISAGIDDVPVIAVGTSGKTINPQPGFNLNWKKLLPITLASCLFADAMQNMFYSTIIREKVKGSAKNLMDYYYHLAINIVKKDKPKELYQLLDEAIEDFNRIDVFDEKYSKVGIVGEIYIKYNSFGNNHVVEWLIEQGVEVIVPPLLDFFIQDFVNFDTNKKLQLRKPSMSDFIVKFFESYANKRIKRVNNSLQAYCRYQPYHNIRDLSKKAEKVISLANQFGEGWLIPAEIAAFAEDGVNQVVSLQPFGCIANHIVSKGIEKKVKELYPYLSLLFLDFDNDISEANILNRLHFIINAAKETDELVRVNK
jgi:predicted CoA-substrate-specific enzyme activase